MSYKKAGKRQLHTQKHKKNNLIRRSKKKKNLFDECMAET